MEKGKKQLFCSFTAIIILAGVFLRLKLWIFNPGLHCDEASLALNLFDTSFAGLFMPLIRLQVAPPLFLVLSKYFYRFVCLNYTPDFSDMMLRLIPLLSGAAAIPAFGYLLNLLFKNKWINLAGMFLLALNSCAISYSCIFKQYSTEMLVTILTFTLFAGLKFNQKYKFFLLGLMPCFSMTSFFLYPGCFLALVLKYWNKKMELFKGFCVFLIPFLTFVLFFLIPVSKTHYSNMESYWSETFALASNLFIYLKLLFCLLFRVANPLIIYGIFIVSIFLMIYKKYQLVLYTVVPIFVTYLFTLTRHYPLSERFILFLLPVVLIILLYPLTFITKKISAVIIGIIIMISGLRGILPAEIVHLKQEYAKEAWEYLVQNYDGSSPVIMGEDFVTNLYYRTFYPENINYYDEAFSGKKNSDKILSYLPEGVWYIIVSRYDDKYYSEFAEYLEQVEVLDYKTFELSSNLRAKSVLEIDAPKSLVVKIRK